ncbi:Delta endotoxin [Akanthomyces lecanii RCEF 1005]|uniref:Delta endotoxin n=1 Tax=Akanthomyces lecanii RCEF 1005 TaxID=1081108 RepID=A0A168I5V1_CORDF|nr:Delta endotoxin [Akanthomyces lecanii RCEF 1005]
MQALTRVWNDYEKATGDSKAKQVETLRTHHIAFLAVLRAGIPEFQNEDASVPSLPLFAQAANIHLTLLADGIRHGAEWGFTPDYVNNSLQREFGELTGSAKKSRVLDANRTRDLAKPTALSKRAVINYPTYAKDTYEKGRKLVKPYKLGNYHGNGVIEALQFNALSDYGSTMTKSVLTYAQFWPYLIGKMEMPSSAKNVLDREIFSGPYARYTTGATWDASKAPPATPRGGNITAVRVRSQNDIDALHVQYGSSWGLLFGSPKGGVEALANLAFDEYTQSIDTHYGFKLGQLTFFSNTDKTHGWYGNGKNSQNQTLVKHEGFGLTSMHVTNWEATSPTDCEGIIFGFRPLPSSLA